MKHRENALPRPVPPFIGHGVQSGQERVPMAYMDDLRLQTETVLHDAHEPLSHMMVREELRHRGYLAPPELVSLALEALCTTGRLAHFGNGYAPPYGPVESTPEAPPPSVPSSKVPRRPGFMSSSRRRNHLASNDR
jgi:hypothetical protein